LSLSLFLDRKIDIIFQVKKIYNPWLHGNYNVIIRLMSPCRLQTGNEKNREVDHGRSRLHVGTIKFHQLAEVISSRVTPRLVASTRNQKCVRNATFPIAHSCDLAEIYRTIIARGTLRRVGVSYQNNGGGRARFFAACYPIIGTNENDDDDDDDDDDVAD